MSKYELEKFSKEFFKSVVQKRLHTVVIEKMMEHKKQGHIIIIASGGFENYLKYFANEYNIEYYFCT
jgi:phosphoserine phosphatase